jgi:hemerythrin superfamily protein
MSATAKPAAKTTKPQDAVALLKQDHDEVKAMFKQYEELGDRAFASKQKLAEKICLELTKHAIAEEEIFYPAVRSDVDDSEDLVDEATVEHASAKDLIAQIHAMDPHDDLYDAKVKVLGEYIDHHVQEEEEEMFPKARKAGIDLVALGEQIQARKDEIEEIPPPMIPPQALEGRRPSM